MPAASASASGGTSAPPPYLRLSPGAGPHECAVSPDDWCHINPRGPYGGQLTAHAVVAAARCAPAGHTCHSCHLLFVRAGSLGEAHYVTTPVRIGRSYALYRVEGFDDSAGGALIATSLVSFHDVAAELVRGAPALGTSRMPVAPRPPPAASSGWPSRAAANADGTLWWFSWADEAGSQPLDARCDGATRAALLGFLSDYSLLATAYAAHGREWSTAMMTSLDHTIHFHAPLSDPLGWLLFETEAVWVASGRALCRGRMWEASTGALVCSATQEGVYRVAERSPDEAGRSERKPSPTIRDALRGPPAAAQPQAPPARSRL
jgi:acyl-CoA thioesterase-2